MFKNDLIDSISKKTGATKAAVQNVIDAFSTTITETLKKGEDVSLMGFLNFKVVETKARKGINPKTKEEIKIKAGKKVKVVIGKGIKDLFKK